MTDDICIRFVCHHPELILPEQNQKSDWLDLRAAESVQLRAGEHRYISLGISVKLPPGYEMWIAPRSSTFKNFGILVPNSPAVIDECFSSDEDIIRLSAYAVRDTEIHLNDRICQCRIMQHQPAVRLIRVDTLGHDARGGLGSTGIR